MINITPQNYFDINNRVLTRSKIKDFTICPNYFYRKHILGEIETEKKKAFLIGSIVDELLTMIDNQKLYAVVEGDGRTKDVKDQKKNLEFYGITVLSADDYDHIIGIASAVENTDAYQTIIKDGYVKQMILQAEMPIGEHFEGLAIMIDFIKFDGDTCTIVDLKTANNIDDQKFHYSAVDYWYYRQMALATILVRLTKPEIEIFKYYDLVVDKTKNIYHTRLFQLANSRVEQEVSTLEGIIESIKEETEFKKYNPSFTTPTLIGEMFDDED
jgi:hypothetical protein